MEPVGSNIRMLPSQVPGEHRFALMRNLLNGELTSHRLHPVNGCEILSCPFCGVAAADSVVHWSVCAAFGLVRAQVYVGADFEVTESGTWLQAEYSGAAQLQNTLAYLSAVIRLRRVIVSGRSFFNAADMVDHFRRLLNDPCIIGSSWNMSASERRSHRARPPEIPADATTYASDGAARNQGATSDRQSSFRPVSAGHSTCHCETWKNAWRRNK